MVLPLLRGRTMRVVPRPITSLHFNCPALSSWVPSRRDLRKAIKVNSASCPCRKCYPARMSLESATLRG